MWLPSFTILGSMVLAFLFGYAAQRGRLCAVSAIHLLIEKKQFDPFLSFFRCSAWVILVSLPAWWLWPAVRVSGTYALHTAGLAGALIFGAGAAVNDGCNFGTLTRLATGETSFAVTVLGGALGVWIEGETFRASLAAPSGTTMLAHPNPVTIALLALVGFWCFIGLVASGNGPNGWQSWTNLAPVVMGLTGGVLYLINGGWAYTLDLDRLVNAPGAGKLPENVLLAMTAATGIGAAVAAWISGLFRLRLDMAALPYRFAGGALMGFGAALVPGGNAVLILQGIPTFSPHALPDYLALCLGIAILLQISGRLRTLACFPV